MCHAAPLALSAQSVDSIPSVDSFIKPGAVRHQGMCNVFVQEGRYLMEVPDSINGRDILSAITIVRGAAQVERKPDKRFGYAGDAVFERVIRFVKAGNKLNIVQPIFQNAQDSTTIYYKIANNTLLPVLFSFPVKAKSDHSVLIDFTETLTGDGDLFALKGAKNDLSLGSLEADKSSILSIRCFPANMNFRSLRTYGPAGENKNSSAWEVGASWVLLPLLPMPQRFADNRVGYFTKSIRDYDNYATNPRVVQLTSRWDLRPKAADVQRYLAGELVEPEHPIVFYIDKHTPAYLVPYFIKGVNAWQQAFEKAGFRHAIYALPEPPDEDSTYAMEDVRFSYISYKGSPIANAYGPHVCDPRSGQIISSRVAVFHNVLDLVQRWYFSMCAATDTAARRYPLSHEVMGRLIQNVITHEVGHTLGLRHNFGGSAFYEVDSIRKPAYVAKNGFGASIMDYMRFNYTAQPEDHMPDTLLVPGIGVYDLFAIEWGYRYLPQFTTPKATADSLERWVTEKRKDVRLRFGTESDLVDPRYQSEDVGSDPVKAGRLGIKNLQLTMLHFDEWMKTSECDPAHYRQQYRSLLGRYHDYLLHALREVGGRYNNREAKPEENLPSYQPVPRARQEAAIAFLEEYLLNYPKWLFDPAIMKKAANEFGKEDMEPFNISLSRLIMSYSQINNNLEVDPKGYTTKELYERLYTVIYSKPATSEFNRELQRTLLTKALSIVESPTGFTDDVSVQLLGIINKIGTKSRNELQTSTDLLIKAHWQSLADMITIWEKGDASSLAASK
ncbi:zinc-dependent metalloprotease [Chitinophaga sp.]|uniref:zinc-dependent metalloprotease n=1 Tax=Chitinophaga sp. TaxID=1869181 RepID=UPI0031E2D9DC